MSKMEKIGVIGLGYVGMPLAMAFADQYDVVGYDVSARRIGELRNGYDCTGEFTDGELSSKSRLTVTDSAEPLESCTFLVIAVPTPLGDANVPDLTALEQSSETVGRVLQKGAMVVYESTVYPGVTEEVCLPILEKTSGLELGDFDLGYSPERVNPGDKEHSVVDILKIVSGHNEPALRRAERVYGSVIRAGIHCAPNIKTAEAAKVIENVQRDLNIALMNELSKIFTRLGIHTDEVLTAAATKWNFHRYHPGLVGGHCIGVDPYYLTHRAMQLGYHPEVILAGRRINDSMGDYIADMTIRAMNRAGTLPLGANVLVMGLTFKENVPDCRNSKAFDVIRHLQDYDVNLRVCEPLLTPEAIAGRFGLEAIEFDQTADLDAVVVINKHDAFQAITLEDLRRRMKTPVLFDAKNLFSRTRAAELGFRYMTL